MEDYERKLIEQGKWEERQRIIEAYTKARHNHLPAEAFNIAMYPSLREKKPGKLRHVESGDIYDIQARLNALIDAVNELREAKE